MKETLAKSKILNISIKQSKEYNEYLEAKKELQSNEDLCNKVICFKNRNKELQSHPDYNPLDEVIALTKEYEEVLNDCVVSRYLQAEQKVCKLMQEVYNKIAEGLEFGELDE